MKVTIYHNARCSTSRNALSILTEKGIEPEVRYYMKDFFTKSELKMVLKSLGMKAFELIRKKESIFKEKYLNLELNNEEWIDILLENPRLIERPIVMQEGRAVVGRPLSNIEDFLACQP